LFLATLKGRPICSETAILLDDKGMDEISLKDSDFYHEPHMFIFRAFTNLNQSQTHIDQITVAEELNRMGKLEAAGGVAYLFYLITVCPSPMDAMVYADIIKRMSISQQLIQVGKEIQDVGFSNPVDVSKALRQCDEKLVTVRKSGLTSPIISPKDRAESLYQRYAELYRKEMSMDGLSDREVAQSAGIPTTSIRLGKYTDEIYDKNSYIRLASNSDVYTIDNSWYGELANMITDPPYIAATLGIDTPSVSYAIVTIGGTETVTVNINNNGVIIGNFIINLLIGNNMVNTQAITLNPRATQVVIFKVAENTPGKYVASINQEHNVTFTVQ